MPTLGKGHRAVLRALAAAGLLGAGPSVLAAQEPAGGSAVALARTGFPITVDGALREEIWSRIPPLPFSGFEPRAGAPPSQLTIVRVAYNDAYLYIGAELRDDRPPSVNGFTRDRWANDDLLEVVLDTWNDNTTAVIFGVNPAGTRFDSQVRDDAEFTFGFPIDYSWNAFWDAATRRDSTGWTVEMRIPFASLRFQPRDGRVTMGLIVSRFIARENETVTYPAIDPRWNFGFNKPSQAQDVLLDGIVPERPLYLAPYALAGDQSSWRSDSTGLRVPVGQSAREIGADARYALGENITVDLTINTDFAQAEADDQQVNLTRFSLFYPEKRQFFQERSGLFDFRTGGSNRLFHSRRIGILDDGSGLARILGGIRAVGRVAGWDFGVLDMQTAAAGTNPAENFLVARGRRSIVNDYSQLGAMITSRAGDAHNLTWGMDALVRLGNSSSRYLSANAAQSVVDGRGGLESGTALLMLEDRDRRGPGYVIGVSRAGKSFDPGVGFVRRHNYRDATLQGTWGVFAGDSSILRRWAPRVEGTYLVRDSDGTFELAEWSTGGEAEFRNGSSIRGGLVVTRERLRDGFPLSPDAAVEAGDHIYVWGRMFATTSFSGRLGGSMFLHLGEFYDGRILNVSLSPRWRIPPFVEVFPEVEWFRVRFPGRGQSFHAMISRLRTTLSLNSSLSADALVQYASDQSRVGANGRLRYRISEGRDLWVVVNEQRDVIHRQGDAFMTEPVERILVVKYVHTFRAR